MARCSKCDDGMLMEAVIAVCACTATCLCVAHHLIEDDRAPAQNDYLTRRGFLDEVIKSEDNCYNLLRMNMDAFQRLVIMLRGSGQLHDTFHCSVDEQLAIFLHIIANNIKNRAIKCYFKRSSDTVSKYFNKVLLAIIGMEYILLEPSRTETPPQIEQNQRFYPYFKDCIGAIDGTHIPVKVCVEHLPEFRGQNHWSSQKYYCSMYFDLKFTYLMAGWEGSAFDSRIITSAITRENDISCPPLGKYYIVDAGYPLLKHFITLFRSTRYHLNEFRDRVPATLQELFNHRHSSLRNAIERAFRVLKKRFKILGEEPMYPFDTQVNVVMACCIVHNHIRGVMPNDPILDLVDSELQTTQHMTHLDIVEPILSRAAEGREGTRIRALIINEM